MECIDFGAQRFRVIIDLHGKKCHHRLYQEAWEEFNMHT